MAAGDTTLVAAQTNAQYRALNAALIGQAFDAMLDITAANSNILAQLQGPMGSGKPFVVRTDLEKGAMDTINFNVGTSLGQAGRRGTQVALNYEEPLFHNSWNVQIDNLRVVVGWNEITRAIATSGKKWEEAYAELCGERIGQIEQEDMLMRCRQRSTSLNTLRPGNKGSIDDLTYSDTLDTNVLGKGIALLSRRGAKPGMVAKDNAGMPLNKFFALGSDSMFQPLWQDPVFAAALLHADVDGPSAAYWTGKLPEWKGTALKRWYIVDNDTPGPIGSSIEPRAVLGDPVTSGNGPLTIDGGGRTASSLGDAAVLFTPFTYFLGNNYAFGESISFGTDSNTYYFVIVDPADGKWNLYSYVQGGVNSNGYSITCSARLASATNTSGSNIAQQTLGNWTWDSSVNKDAFPTGSLVIQVNANVVPIGDLFIFGKEAGAKCYGMMRNKRISQDTDYGARVGIGVQSYYGSDLRKDTLGNFRGFVRIQAAYEIPEFANPQL